MRRQCRWYGSGPVYPYAGCEGTFFCLHYEGSEVNDPHRLGPQKPTQSSLSAINVLISEMEKRESMNSSSIQHCLTLLTFGSGQGDCYDMWYRSAASPSVWVDLSSGQSWTDFR
jgi:hypothetical protein